MYSTNQTINNPLQALDELYRTGYRSNTLERALNKIVDIEIAIAHKQLTELQAKIQNYEQQYQMNSEAFYQRFNLGELGDDVDFVEWSAFYDMHQAVSDRLKILQPKGNQWTHNNT
jgi:phage-related tail protein